MKRPVQRTSHDNQPACDAGLWEESLMRKILGGVVAGIALAMIGTQPGVAADKLKVGVLATLEGTYTVLGEDGVRGFQVALKEFGGKAGGRDIEVIIAPTDA